MLSSLVCDENQGQVIFPTDKYQREQIVKAMPRK
jgi:hypothetical protein